MEYMAAQMDCQIEGVISIANNWKQTLRDTTNWASSKGVRIDVRNNPELWDSVIDEFI